MPHIYAIVDEIILHNEICKIVRAKAYKSADTQAVYVALINTKGDILNSALYNFPAWFTDWEETDNYRPHDRGHGRTIEVAIAADVLRRLAHESGRNKSRLSIVAVNIDNVWTSPLPYKIGPFLTVPE